ncbi:MAG: pyridoxal phosphate-dependent class II aminotransferase [Rhodospirillaceae bacterium]|nr:pyridoxal phosphate-dependent class II aminotransferase [Rhodospirillaceae bacterium]
MTAKDPHKVLRRHGGSLDAARAAFPAARLPWIDLSTGVNPYPWRGLRPGRGDITRLPDPNDIAGLEAKAAAAFGCDPACIAAVPGADIGLRFMPTLTQAASVAIVSPTYGGHAEAWPNANAISRDSIPKWKDDAVVVVNPNNPDGGVTPKETLLAHKNWLIVDESFADAMPEISVASHVRGRLIVLRSFGKFYGLPGLRLGFIVAAPDMIARVRAMTGDWPVSADAIRLGAAAYADTAWQTRTRARLTKTARRLDKLLARHGFHIVGGTPLFRLAHRPDAAACFQRLGEAGILVRPFEDAPTQLRFGLPAPAAWSRLEAALKACS